MSEPVTAVRATTPVRIADVGGWTDTWFGGPGQVCHVGVGPGVSVAARLVERATDAASVHLVAPDVGLSAAVGPGADGWRSPAGSGHALLDHSVATVLEGESLPVDRAVEVEIRSGVPAGASLGTSAAVVVALLAALDALVAGGERSPADLAVLAHQVETQRAGRESGVQDQWAAAEGGAALLAIGPYPQVRRRALVLPEGIGDDLAARTLTAVFGAHDSSAVHRAVIDALMSCGDVVHDRVRRALRRLSELAVEAATALEAGDLDAWAQVLVAATDQQAAMHPGLVGDAHQVTIDAARSAGAIGWKVNGAGGGGGSLTVVAPDAASADRLGRRLQEIAAVAQVLRLAPAGGVQVERLA